MKIHLTAALLLFFSILCPRPATAQWSWGPSVGLNAAGLQTETIPNRVESAIILGGQMGGQVGLAARYAFGPRIAARLGGQLQFRTNYLEQDTFFLEDAFAYQLWSVQVPLTFELTPTERWFILAGLECGSLLGPLPNREDWQRLDFGFTFGAGFAISPNLHLHFNYLVGLPRVAEGRFRDEETQVQGVYYFRSRTLQAGLTFYLPAEP